VNKSLALSKESIHNIKDTKYFQGILDNGESVMAPQYMSDTFQGIQLDIFNECYYLTLDGKNRSISTALLYLWDNQYGTGKIGDIKIPFVLLAVPKRKICSVLYQRIAYGKPPNRMMIRIGELSKTGDLVDSQRELFFEQTLTLRIGYKVPVKRVVDLMDIFFTDTGHKKLDDLKYLIGSMSYLDMGNYGDETDTTFDDYYKLELGDHKLYKKFIKYLHTFSKYYYLNVFNKKKIGNTRLELRGGYMVMVLCKLLTQEDYKITPSNWKKLVVRFYEWFITERSSDNKIWNNGKDDYSFSGTLGFWLTSSEARDILTKKFVEEFFSKLEDDGIVEHKSPKKSLKAKDKIKVWTEGNIYSPPRSWRFNGKPNGELFSDTLTTEKRLELEKKWDIDFNSESHYVEISFQQIFNSEGDHIIPQDKGGPHHIDNWDLTIPEYNNWKRTKIPNYKKIKK
jgi:hypothetical protein